LFSRIKWLRLLYGARPQGAAGRPTILNLLAFLAMWDETATPGDTFLP
jgi:hypothetical protein